MARTHTMIWLRDSADVLIIVMIIFYTELSSYYIDVCTKQFNLAITLISVLTTFSAMLHNTCRQIRNEKTKVNDCERLWTVMLGLFEFVTVTTFAFWHNGWVVFDPWQWSRTHSATFSPGCYIMRGIRSDTTPVTWTKTLEPRPLCGWIR